jgi:hypothetical protein
MKVFCWIVTILCCAFAAIGLFDAIAHSSGAPQQAAGAAIAAAFAIIPYVFSRAVSELAENKIEKQNERIIKLLSGEKEEPQGNTQQNKPGFDIDEFRK